MMMGAFEEAWQVVKMARHILNDDIEIWDMKESGWNGGKWGQKNIPEGYEHLPLNYDPGPMPKNFGWGNTHGTLENDEWSELPEDQWYSYRNPLGLDFKQRLKRDGMIHTDVPGWNFEKKPATLSLPEGRETPFSLDEMNQMHEDYWNDPKNNEHYWPISGGYPGTSMAKPMMTPKQFLALADAPRRESRHKNTLDWMRRTIEGNAKIGGRTPIGMPFLDLALENTEGVYPDKEKGIEPLSGPDTYRVRGHEGRHRMQTLVDMGHGDTPVPIMAGSRDKHSWGVYDEEPGHNKMWSKNLPGSTILPQGASEGNKPFKIEEINNEWRKGVYDRL